MAPKRKSSGSRTPRGLSGETVQGCLATLGLTDLASAFTGCANIEDEFKVIKRAWHKQCLSAHPDKGGSEELFRAVQAAFEVLKAKKTGGSIASFGSSSTQKASTSSAYKHAAAAAAKVNYPSADFYAKMAAEINVPLYRVELARSDRSSCVQGAKNCRFANGELCHPPVDSEAPAVEEAPKKVKRLFHSTHFSNISAPVCPIFPIYQRMHFFLFSLTHFSHISDIRFYWPHFPYISADACFSSFHSPISPIYQSPFAPLTLYISGCIFPSFHSPISPIYQISDFIGPIFPIYQRVIFSPLFTHPILPYIRARLPHFPCISAGDFFSSSHSPNPPIYQSSFAPFTPIYQRMHCLLCSQAEESARLQGRLGARGRGSSA